MWRRAGELDDLWIGEMKATTVEGQRVLLVNVDGQVQAFADRCAHQRSPLSLGRLTGRVLTCGVHGWEYDAVTGEGLNPLGVALTRYPVEVRQGAIWIDVNVPVER
jgi:toluene monooxygenase system ferredoxin subunit